MQTVLAPIFLLLFGLCTVFTYVSVRRRWTRVLFTTFLGILGDTLTIGWASLARGTWLPQAMLTGFVLGVMFTAMTVSIGMFYRANPPGELPNPPRKPKITPVSAISQRTPPPPEPPQSPESPQSPSAR